MLLCASFIRDIKDAAVKAREKFGFLDYFDDLEDPRVTRTKVYPLNEILFVVICAMICGADSWRDFVDFGETKFDYLKKFFPFKNGIPSKNTFARVMSAINPTKFKECFLEWVKQIQIDFQDIIAIDGKAIRGSFDYATSKSALHLVSAFSTSLKLILAQEKVSEKSNEITAIPKLLEMLEIKGAIITIDAVGCQKKIASNIREKQADYIFALKENQGKLLESVKFFFETKISTDINEFEIYEENNKGHGRIENRKYFTTDNIGWLPKHGDWKDLKSIVMVQSTREVRKNVTVENRFYITSLASQPELIGRATRSHWAIENSLHWVLDVTFREDNSRIREKNAAENIGLVRKIALNLLQSVKNGLKDMSIRRLRKKSGWDNKTLETVLMSKY
jgi:predicted transposase YbfD/YdcC